MLYTIFYLTFFYLVSKSHPHPHVNIPYEHEKPGFESSSMTEVMRLITEERVRCKFRGECPLNIDSVVNLEAKIECTNGVSNGYPCSNVHLLSFVSLADLGAPGASGNDIWGWKSPNTGRYYALVGTTTGTSFVDISNPISPVVIGFLKSQVNAQVTWRDIKIYNNYAYIVADDYLNKHGMQVVNLQALDSGTIDHVAQYNQFGSCHNIVINEDSGYAYAVGTRTCSGGLHQIDIRVPSSPTFAGCFSSDGYTHDSQCVTYNGLDSQYVGHEICYNYNEDTLTIVDVTNHNSPSLLSRTGYPLSAYTHQGWLNDDYDYLFLDDELDEDNNGFNTRTHLWDVKSLSNPVYKGYFSSPFSAIDHNLYFTKLDNGNGVFVLSNYEAGVIIYQPASDYSSVQQIGYFDTYPSGTTINFNGCWSNYPFWMAESIGGYTGVIIAQDINRGFFVIQYSNNGGTTQTIPLTKP